MTQTTPAALDPEALRAHVEGVWDDLIVPAIEDYIRIPNKSPHFDADWESHGFMEQAVNLVADWCKARPIAGLEVKVVRLEGRTPLVFMEIPAFGGGPADRTVVLYGHLDKQPEMVGWDDDLGPWIPVRKGDKLYGRGGADDGYAAFASLTAIEALQRQGLPHARCVVLIEACEESGSYDLPAYVEHLSKEIGEPELVVCLDSGAGNYEQMWLTTSLRGNVTANFSVELISEGVHSGDASGIVPSSFRVMRELLSRLEDPKTGEILPRAFHEDIPAARVDQAKVCASVLGPNLVERFPWHDGVKPVNEDLVESVLNRTWRPALAVTGVAGMPAIENAGNVMRPITTVKLSMRLPPTVTPEAAIASLKETLLSDPPYGAKVTLDDAEGAQGWHAPPLAPWLEEAVDRASHTYFGKGSVQMGEGGTIPFMGMLGDSYPKAQFVITGVLGPGSNAHGPNEFLHVPMGKGLTCCVAQLLGDHAHSPKV